MSLDLDGIEARAALATPGPWHGSHAFNGQCVVIGDFGWVCAGSNSPKYDVDDAEGLKDAEFIAHARTDVPALVAEVRRLYAVINRVRDAVNEHRSDPGTDATVPAGAIFAAIYLSDRPITDRHIRRAHEIEALIEAEKEN